MYRRWELYSLPLMLVFVPPFTAFWWWFLYGIGVWIAHRFSGAVYNLYPIGMSWGIPAFLLGILTTIPPITLFYRWRLKSRYSEFERYLNLRHQYNHDAAGIPLLVFFGTIILVAVLLILHYRVILTNDEIVQYPFFSFSSRSHKYSDITDIRTAPQRVLRMDISGKMTISKPSSPMVGCGLLIRIQPPLQRWKSGK